MVLTNPPFGKKSSVTIVGENGESRRDDLTVVRDDFWATTSNKQLNFVQHVKTLLKIEGRAAIVVPDNVLFEGGAGETVRRRLLHECDVHTLLRLPTGVFYAQGVKANVLFFDRKPASETPSTRALWVYDLRTNMHFTLKENPLRREHLDDFVACYHAENRGQRTETERFHRFTYDELIARDKVSLDLFWLRDESLEDAANFRNHTSWRPKLSKTSKLRWPSSAKWPRHFSPCRRNRDEVIDATIHDVAECRLEIPKWPNVVRR